MAEEQKKEEEKKEEGKVELGTVPTGQATVYKLPDGKVLNLDEYLVWLGNLMYKISKSVAG